MMNRIKFGLFALAVGGFLMSCNNDNKVREEAAQSVSGTEVQEGVGLSTRADGMTTDAAGAQETATVPTGPTTTIQFAETEFDFGTVDQGKAVTHVFKFKNTGSEPLVINSAKASCGCTVPSWPKEPIAPGKEGQLSVQFDTKGKSGVQNKKVTITANTNPQQTFVYMKGTVNAPQGAATSTPN